jgi:uncharacterized protein DUF6894
MRRYYFDLSGEHPLADANGTDFDSSSDAIQYSRNLAQKLCRDGREHDPSLHVIVRNENGAEIHKETVFSGKPEQRPYGPAAQ